MRALIFYPNVTSSRHFFALTLVFFTKNLFSTVKFDIRSLASGSGVIYTIWPSPAPSVLGLSKKALGQAEWCRRHPNQMEGIVYHISLRTKKYSFCTKILIKLRPFHNCRG